MDMTVSDLKQMMESRLADLESRLQSVVIEMRGSQEQRLSALEARVVAMERAPPDRSQEVPGTISDPCLADV